VCSSDHSVKAGVFVFNKFDENELRGQLSKDNVELLMKAKQLLEDDSDGRTLKDKLPELRQLLFDTQEKLEKTATEIKASENPINETLKKAKELSAEAAKLKEAEQKAADKAFEEAKKTQPSGLVNIEISKPADVPPAAAGPQDTPEDKRRKMQEAISKYIAGLRTAIDTRKKAADAAWAKIAQPANKNNSRSFAADEVEDLYAALAYQEENLAGLRTYVSMQSLENSARVAAANIAAFRAQLETQKGDIKTGIEPLLTEIAGFAAQWKSAHNAYTPLGYHVPEPENVKNLAAWSVYYEGPLKYAEGYLRGTEGLEGRFKAAESAAAAQKNAIYAEAKGFMTSYAAKLQAFKDYKPQVTGQLARISAAAAVKNEILNNLPNDFASEFAYDGKYDLAHLEAKVAAARPAFAEAQKLYAGGSALYQDLFTKYSELSRMSSDPLWSEGANISYMAEDKAHKSEMAGLLKKTAGYSPDLTGTEGWQHDMNAGADLMFGAEEALTYLKAQSARLAGVYSKALTGFKANTAKDLSYLSALDDEKYGAAVEELFAPVQKAEEEKQRIIEEVRKAPLFGGAKLFERTGFWTVQAGAKRDELEKAAASFWGSPAGKAISDARRGAEIQAAADKRDPGAAAVRKLYEDFARAYESRDAARVMAFVAEDWTAGDGTSASDLDEQFRNIFRVYDEIKVTISGLNVVNDAPGLYTASYNMEIRSRIYKKNIKREETSSVNERLTVENGKPRIKKTEAGGYWTVK